MEKGCGEGTLGVPMMPFWESSSGWEINKQIEAKALLIERRMKNRVGHFGVYTGLKFERDVQRIALTRRWCSGVNAIPAQSG